MGIFSAVAATLMLWLPELYWRRLPSPCVFVGPRYCLAGTECELCVTTGQESRVPGHLPTCFCLSTGELGCPVLMMEVSHRKILESLLGGKLYNLELSFWALHE